MSYITDKNGNYKRSVRCGYCYEVGHNKGSCQAKKDNHREQIAYYEQQIAEDKFSDDWDRDYAKRLLAQHKSSLEKSANRGKNRKCSYCKDEGHTRRTCSFRKGDMNSYATKCIAAREKFVANMAAVGFGIGALGYRRDPWGESDSQLTIVESINWDLLTHNVAIDGQNQYSDLVGVRCLQPAEHYPTGRTYRTMMPTEVSNIDNCDVPTRLARRCFEVVSPGRPRCARRSFDAGVGSSGCKS